MEPALCFLQVAGRGILDARPLHVDSLLSFVGVISGIIAALADSSTPINASWRRVSSSTFSICSEYQLNRRVPNLSRLPGPLMPVSSPLEM